MPFIKDSRIKGLVYVPEEASNIPKKHPCHDCHSCRMCPEIKCELCIIKNPGLSADCQKKNCSSG
jgi:hypothetical protein